MGGMEGDYKPCALFIFEAKLPRRKKYGSFALSSA
jgi:hypothetical protein